MIGGCTRRSQAQGLVFFMIRNLGYYTGNTVKILWARLLVIYGAGLDAWRMVRW